MTDLQVTICARLDKLISKITVLRNLTCKNAELLLYDLYKQKKCMKTETFSAL